MKLYRRQTDKVVSSLSLGKRTYCQSMYLVRNLHQIYLKQLDKRHGITIKKTSAQFLATESDRSTKYRTLYRPTEINSNVK